VITQSKPTGQSSLWDFQHPDSFRFDIAEINDHLVDATAEEVIEWATGALGDSLVLTTSFGIQSAVMLDLATRVNPDISVVWVDTGYLPAETYRYAEALTRRLNLNLTVVRSPLSPAKMEAAFGKLWESTDVDDLDLFDRIRKVEPMKRAMKKLGARAWLSGLRSEQTKFRGSLRPLGYDGERYKVLPILGWTLQDVYDYLARRNLPHHPLFYEGYATVGDAHSSRPVTADDVDERVTRFGGLKEECGIHLPGALAETDLMGVAVH